MARTYPSDFLKEDRKMAKMLTPDNVFVTDMIVVLRWMDSDGQECWRSYHCTADTTMSSRVGLLEFAKQDVLNRCRDVFPQYVNGDEGND